LNLWYDFFRKKEKAITYANAKMHLPLYFQSFSNTKYGGADMHGTKFISDLITDPNQLL